MHRFDAVIHFAGRKAVGESVAKPMLYYTHNVLGTVNLIEAMRKHNVKNVRPCHAHGMNTLIPDPQSPACPFADQQSAASSGSLAEHLLEACKGSAQIYSWAEGVI